jgi:hypothetical protein
MKFEVLNSIGKTVMQCSEINCIPDNNQLSLMANAGYKFKINDKVVSQNKIKEFIKNYSE